MTKPWVWAKKEKKTHPLSNWISGGVYFLSFFAQMHCLVTNHNLLSSIKFTSNFFKQIYYFTGDFNTPKSFQNPNCHISLETSDNLWYFGWLRFFYFQTFVTELFRLKKKIPEKSQKNVRGQSCLFRGSIFSVLWVIYTCFAGAGVCLFFIIIDKMPIRAFG